MTNYNDDPAKEKRKDSTTPKKERDDDKFSPGEPDDYNAEKFSTD